MSPDSFILANAVSTKGSFSFGEDLGEVALHWQHLPVVYVYVAVHCLVHSKRRVVSSILPFVCLLSVATRHLNRFVLGLLLGESGHQVSSSTQRSSVPRAEEGPFRGQQQGGKPEGWPEGAQGARGGSTVERE